MTPSQVHPLARSSAPTALDWETVEPEATPRPADALGLSPEDRAALGMSRPATTAAADLWPAPSHDAKAALADALARGAAYGKLERHGRRR